MKEAAPFRSAPSGPRRRQQVGGLSSDRKIQDLGARTSRLVPQAQPGMVGGWRPPATVSRVSGPCVEHAGYPQTWPMMELAAPINSAPSSSVSFPVLVSASTWLMKASN